MSDKNFKVKNGIDAVGPITISPSSNSIDGIVINTPIGGKAIRFIRVGTGEVGSIDEWGGLTTSGGIQVVQPWYVRNPGLEAQSHFWTPDYRSAAGFGGTSTGTNPVIYISSWGGGTNDLTQWVTPNNTILAKVDYLGNITARDLTLSGNLTVNGTTTNLNSTNLIIEDKNIIIADVATPTDTTADGAGITIKGATDKTFNWVQSTGRFTSSEPVQSSAFVSTYIYASQIGSTVIGTATLNTNSDTGGLLINTAGAANKGLIVRGATSQTSTLQEWQNISGTVLASVNASGKLQVGTTVLAAASQIGAYGSISTNMYDVDFGSGGSRLMIDYVPGGNGRIGAIAGGTVTTSGIEFWTTGTGGIYAGEAMRLTATGRLGIGTTSPSAQLQVNSSSASTAALIVKGAASQSANLQEWQNSAGTSLVSVSSDGTIRGGGSFLVDGTYGITNIRAATLGASLNVGTGYLAQQGIIVRGAASQISNLQEWQNSAGTVLARVDSNGSIYSGLNLYVSNAALFTTSASNYYNATVSIDAQGAAYSGLVIRGRASQSANLQEWQNSAGTVVARVDNGGNSLFNTVNLTYLQNAAASGPYLELGANNIIAVANGAAKVPFIARGAASQTANLFETQDSSGNTLVSLTATVSSTNTLKFTDANSFALNWGNSPVLFTAPNPNTLIASPYNAARIGFIVKGLASQSADLQQWQNSAGTVLTNISSTGKLTSAVDASINGMTIGLGSGNVSSNVAFGQGALASNVSGQNNTAIGYNALNSSTSWFNVAIGGSALQALTTGGTNVALGVLAMRSATTADSAVAIGYNAAGATTTGGYFVAIGAGALGANITGGSDTVAIGYAALNQATATSATTAVGSGAGYALTTGTQNTYLGRIADGVTTGSNNMMLGYSATASSTTVSNEITLGNSSITRFRIPGIGLNITSNSTVNTASASTVGLIVKGAASQTANLQEWQNSAGTVLTKVDNLGNFTAISKSFDIIHPTKENMRLRYGSLEGPENGVYIRGTAESNIIELPDYWTGLVHEDSITVSLTSVGSAQNIYVEKIENNKIYIGGNLEKAFFTVYGERKDIDKLTVEY